MQTETAVRTLTGIMRQKAAPASARAFCATALLDRGWGKAPMQLTGEDGGPLTVIIRQIIDITEQSEADDVKLIDHEPEDEAG